MTKLTCLCVSTLILLVALQYGTCKYVSVSLDARWPSTPVTLEMAEYVAKEDHDLFWRFVDDVCRSPEQHEKMTEMDRFNRYKQFVTDNLSTQLSGLMDLSLSLRAHSPAVEMNHQLLRDHLTDIDTTKRCSAFVVLGDTATCDTAGLEQAVNTLRSSGHPTDEPIYKTDKVYPSVATSVADNSAQGSSNNLPTGFLYGEIGMRTFCSFHAALTRLALDGKVRYVLRHFVQATFATQGSEDNGLRTRLSGYGVELAIKSTEYKAKDDAVVRPDAQTSTTGDADKREEAVLGFDFSRLRKLYPKLQSELDALQQHLRESTKEIPSLAVWQLQDLSFQAAQRVLNAGGIGGLLMLRDVAQNYPMRATTLSRTPVNSSLRSEALENQRWYTQTLNVPPGGAALFLNGIDTDVERFDIFTSLDRIRDEIRSTSALYALGFRGPALRDVITISLKDAGASGFGNGEYALNVLPAITPVTYVNNLERDEQYRNWLSSVNDLLRPMFPGVLPQVRRNLFNVLIVCDPLAKECRHLLTTAESFYVHAVPARVGLVLLPDPKRPNPISALLVKLFHYIEQDENAYRALSFLTDVFTEEGTPSESTGQAEPALTREVIRRVFEREYDEADWIDFERHDSEYTEKLERATEFFRRSGFSRLPQVLVNGIPLGRRDLDEDEFESALGTTIYRQLNFFQMSVYHGRLSDADDILEFVMRQPNVVPRLNHRVISALRRADDSSGADHRTDFVDFGSDDAPDSEANTKALSFASLDSLSNRAFTARFATSLRYLAKKDEPDVYEVSNWVVLDFDSPAGRELAVEALKHLKSSAGSTRIAFIHNPANSSSTASADGAPHFLARVMQATIETVSNNAAKNFLNKLLKSENADAVASGTRSLEDVALHGMDVAALRRTIERLGTAKTIELHAAFARRTLGLEPGARAIVSNGRRIGPLDTDESFTSDDLLLIDKMTLTGGMSTLRRLARSLHADAADRPERTSDLLMRAACILNANPQSTVTRTKIAPPKTTHSLLRVEPVQPDQPALEIDAVLDPLSKDAQKLSHVLVVLAESLNVRIRVWMNPREKLSEAPLRNFYRFVLETAPSWNESSGALAVGAPTAYFSGLPERSLLTLNMDTPHAWMVESVRAIYDLDNIVLQEVPDAVHAEYELEYLLIEGHCSDMTTGQPPRGSQFTLGTRRNPLLYDTIVMANLGYFQLKSAPGAWILRLRAGRSEDIYRIAAHDYTDSPADYTDVVVVRDSLSSKIIRVKLEKKPDHLNDDVLGANEDEQRPSGFWSTITRSMNSFFVGRSEPSKPVERDSTLNIFSVASGHLYERFLRLMMLSVLKHTKSRVKFWFLKNYLSPSFKSSISYMAAHYGFEYELVQYKWPRWLHAQTEKQRLIWGYKILFLDVLFPLDVRKVIFVDADQIVRADMQELYDLDLEGAPYGYTPFCDSRKEMDGFRFWKGGYWAQHLGHRRYHISALYVIDLVKFRRVAAGDRLRGQYQALSQDPNSLSNLDQDLPNNMIHQVAIKSLPQEWLWCETWCSDTEKTRAKTIDLCNNPLTKEPKLSAAVRIIPEWQSYDDEIKQVLDKFYAERSAASPSTTTQSSSDDAASHAPSTTARTEL